jgi:hypothetical protein
MHLRVDDGWRPDGSKPIRPEGSLTASDPKSIRRMMLAIEHLVSVTQPMIEFSRRKTRSRYNMTLAALLGLAPLRLVLACNVDPLSAGEVEEPLDREEPVQLLPEWNFIAVGERIAHNRQRRRVFVESRPDHARRGGDIVTPLPYWLAAGRCG